MRDDLSYRSIAGMHTQGCGSWMANGKSKVETLNSKVESNPDESRLRSGRVRRGDFGMTRIGHGYMMRRIEKKQMLGIRHYVPGVS